MTSKKWREDQSVAQHQVKSDEVMDLIQQVLNRLDQDAIAAIRGCEASDLYYTINHPGGFYCREERTNTLEIRIGNYGTSLRFLDGQIVDHCGGFGLDTVFRLQAPSGKFFRWSFSNQSDPAWMWGYAEEEGQYNYTRVVIIL